MAYKKAFTNQEFQAVKRSMGRFKKSSQGKHLKKEMHEFGTTLKKNVEVTDIPEHWKKGMNNLKITVHNQDEIEKEWNDVGAVEQKIMHSQPVRNLESSLNRWADSGEVEHLKALDDVADQYEQLEKTHWAKAYNAGFEAAFNNKEAHSVGRRWEQFLGSAEGKAWAKEMMELDASIKKNVKVTDIPEHWKKGMNNLKITVHNQDQIEKEANDVGAVEKKIMHSQPVRNLDSSIKRWADSEEVDHLKALDKAFMASPEGKRLIAEWTDVFKAVDKHVYTNDSGMHIDNGAMPEIEDELDDVADQYEQLEGSKWDKAYTAGWNAAVHNNEAESVGRRWDQFLKSPEGQAWAKEVMELHDTIKKNVKVTDIPEHWKKGMNALKVTIHNQDQIKDEFDDVGETWESIKGSRPVRNLGSSLERWGDSAEVKHLEELDKKFKASPAGKRLIAEWTDVFKAVDKHTYYNKKGFHVDNNGMQEIGDELQDVGAQYDQLEGSKWDKAYTAGWKAALHNKEAKSVGRRAESFKKSAEGKALGKEMKELHDTLEKNVEVTDVPEAWKRDMYLF